jgi:AcrR family transcriptional regulator
VRIVGVKGQVQQRGVQRRRVIVRAALELFARHGYRGTSVAAIAARARVPTSSITYYFGTKENLLQAVLEEVDRQALANIDDDHRPGLRAAAERLIRNAEHMRTIPQLIALHTTLTAESIATTGPMLGYFRRRNHLLRENLAAALRHSAEHGEIDPGIDPDTKAIEIAAFLEGVALQWLLDPDVDLIAIYRGYLDGLITQLGRHTPK